LFNKKYNKTQRNSNEIFDFNDEYSLNLEKYKLGYNYPIYPNHKYGYRLLFDIYIYI